MLKKLLLKELLFMFDSFVAPVRDDALRRWQAGHGARAAPRLFSRRELPFWSAASHSTAKSPAKVPPLERRQCALEASGTDPFGEAGSSEQSISAPLMKTAGMARAQKNVLSDRSSL